MKKIKNTLIRKKELLLFFLVLSNQALGQDDVSNLLKSRFKEITTWIFDIIVPIIGALIIIIIIYLIVTIITSGTDEQAKAKNSANLKTFAYALLVVAVLWIIAKNVDTLMNIFVPK